MAELVHDVRDVRERPVQVREVRERRRARPGAMLLMFVLGVICAIGIGVVALSIFDIHGTISWPAGRIEVGQNATPHVLIRHDIQKAEF